MTSTEKYIQALVSMKTGEISLLRTHIGQGLDKSASAFDLFAGLWWPLRAKNERAPRREVAWMIAKLFAYRPIPHSKNRFLALQLRRFEPVIEKQIQSYHKRFDRLIQSPLEIIEPELQWALDHVARNGGAIDWVKLTDDLSIWGRHSTRQRWVEQYLYIERNGKC
jgi:CRISPR type I-E-associated protein CasB/Cse2